MTRRTGITARHCQCVKCSDNGRRACSAGCSHRDRYQVRKRMPDGSRPSRWFSTYAKAERFLAELEGEWRDQKVSHAVETPAGLLPISEAAAAWLATTRLDTEPSSALGYKQIIDKHLNPALGDRRVIYVTQAEVQTLITAWSAEQAPQTVRNRVNVLLPILRSAGNRIEVGKQNGGLVPPTNRNREGTETAVVSRRLFLETTDELRMLVAALPERYRVFTTFLALVGCRPGEAMKLRQSDIVNGQRIQISRAAKRVAKSGAHPEGVRVGDTKTHTSRIVWVPPSLLDELRDQSAPGDALLFSEPDGTWLDYGRYCRTFRKARTALPSGLAKLRVYDLRHTAASILANRGASILVVAQQLGHSDPSITATTYAHLFQSTVDQLMGKVDEDVSMVLG